MSKEKIKVSKFLSYVLRHQPEAIGLQLDSQGWASVDELINCAAANNQYLTRKLLEEIVATNDKKRFSFSADAKRIRANQGHSLNIDLGLEPLEPPPVLYHGTARRFLDSILQTGLNSAKRHHVHLSVDEETAIKVGQRHGKPIVLKVDAKLMHKEGHKFFCSENGVWLTNYVAPKYLEFLASSRV